MGRARKKLRKAPDFQRKRNKVGKGKQVPNNVTQIKFKSKRVVVPYQWESDPDGPTSHRKQTLQVLFAQVHHHNSSVRHDALVGLQAVFQSHPDLLLVHLAKLVDQVFITVVDKSALVRQASRLLMRCILNGVPNEALRPFFTTLIAHLKCGLTHIQERIQLDSLQVLELYVNCCLGLLVEHVGSLLHIFMGILSRQQAGTLKRTEVVKTGRHVLVSDPSSHLLSENSRLCILKLISTLLELLLGKTESIVEEQVEKRREICGLCSDIASVLMESWLESHPNDAFQCKGNHTQHLRLMEVIISVLSWLLKLMQTLVCDHEIQGAKMVIDTCQELCVKLSTQVACHFPFQVPILSVQELFQHFYVMNFTFCEIGTVLQSLLSLDVSNGLLLAVLDYLSSLNSNDMKYITSSVLNLTCTKIIISITVAFYDNMSDIVHEEVSAGVWGFIKNFYMACHPHSKSKQLLIKCFKEMFDKELVKSRGVVMKELLLPWSGMLLDLLSDVDSSNTDTSSVVIDSLATAATIQSSAVFPAMEQKLIPYLVSSIGFVCKFSELLQKKLVGLVWHLPVLVESDLAQLSRLCFAEGLHVHVKQYLIQIVHHKYMREDLDTTLLSSTPPYLSFMFTILMGYNSVRECSECGLEPIKMIDKSNAAISARNYIQLHQTVCDCLKATPISSAMLSCLEECLFTLSVMPVNAVCGVLTLGTVFCTEMEESASSGVVSTFSNLCMSLLIAANDSASVGDQELLHHSTKLAFRIMSVCPKVLETLLQLFTSKITSAGLECDDFVRSMTRVLTHPDLHKALLKIRSRVLSPLGDVMTTLSDLPLIGVRVELEKVVRDFLRIV